jgi:hypothetical protein
VELQVKGLIAGKSDRVFDDRHSSGVVLDSM